MSKIKTAMRYIKTPGKMIKHIADNGLLNWLPDKIYLKLAFRGEKNKRLNLENPITFNEKLQWLKIYDRNPDYCLLVDKYAVKKVVSEKIGYEYIIPTIRIWDRIQDVNFDLLPNKFVLKCTHDSGSVIVCKDKSNLDKEKALKQIGGNLKKDPYWFGREWPYRGVKPRIIAEKLLEDDIDGEVKDYKFFCFNGVVKCFKIDFNRFLGHRANYYSPRGKLLKFGEQVCPPDYEKELCMPYNLDKMISLAEILSKDIPFVRVDFYESNKLIFFGELTLYPDSGFGTFIPEEWDTILGDWLLLPNLT